MYMNTINENRPGYKKTKVGWIPEEWEFINLEEISDKITDGTHDTPKKIEKGVPYLTAIHVKNGFIDFKNCYYVDKEVHRRIFKRCNPEKGDLLMVNIGAGTATCALVNINYEFSLKNVALIKPNGKMVHSQFLYAFQSYYRDKLFHRLTSGGAQPFLSLKSIKKLRLPLPPLPEQKKIATILSTWDAAIRTLDRLIERKQTLKKGLMQQLLTGQRRFPEFVPAGGTRYRETKLGLVPEDWEVVRLGMVSSIDSESLSSKEDPNYTFKYLSLSSIKSGRITEPPEVIQFKDAPSRARRVIKKGDVLFSTVRPNLEGHYRLINNEANIASTGFAIVREKKKLLNDYFYHYLFSSSIRRQIHALVVGSNYPAINSSDVKKIKVALPSISEQQRIGEIFFRLNETIEKLKQKKERFQKQKKGLMQQLLTGAVRIKL